jgi:osmotically-inducible protein OsmY
LDGDIQRALVDELARDAFLRVDGITVTVAVGIVDLEGSTALPAWRERAERVARVVRGVRAVVNRIHVTPAIRRDREVAQEVRRALRDTPALAGMPIRVGITRGVVELDGAITSWEEQQLAERVASGIPGVRFCVNQLSLGPPGMRTDAVLAGDVRSRLNWDPLVEHDPIRVAVRSSRVMLSGKVGSRAEAWRAFTLGSVKGVSTVDVSRLEVDNGRRPDSNARTTWPSDAQISATIAELAHYWPSAPLASLSVAVVGGNVTLRGAVATLGESRNVEQLVRSAVGVVKIDDQLQGPWRQQAAVASRIRRRFGRP